MSAIKASLLYFFLLSSVHADYGSSNSATQAVNKQWEEAQNTSYQDQIQNDLDAESQSYNNSYDNDDFDDGFENGYSGNAPVYEYSPNYYNRGRVDIRRDHPIDRRDFNRGLENRRMDERRRNQTHHDELRGNAHRGGGRR